LSLLVELFVYYACDNITETIIFSFAMDMSIRDCIRKRREDDDDDLMLLKPLAVSTSEGVWLFLTVR
jgi:hypothetical protein